MGLRRRAFKEAAAMRARAAVSRAGSGTGLLPDRPCTAVGNLRRRGLKVAGRRAIADRPPWGGDWSTPAHRSMSYKSTAIKHIRTHVGSAPRGSAAARLLAASPRFPLGRNGSSALIRRPMQWRISRFAPMGDGPKPVPLGARPAHGCRSRSSTRRHGPRVFGSSADQRRWPANAWRKRGAACAA